MAHVLESDEDTVKDSVGQVAHEQVVLPIYAVPAHAAGSRQCHGVVTRR